MIRIERHISDLLLENDCISIPGMGGLVTQRFRAEINPGTNIMRPPSKRISFHEGLTANAHLLVTKLSNEERISLAKANDLIELTVKNWQLTLAAGDSIKLEGIGRFYQDKQGAVCFNQSLEANFDLDAFGLDMFRATAIARDAQIKEAVNDVISQTVGTKKKVAAFPLWRAAAVFAGIGALLTVGFFKSDVNLNDRLMANFNPLHYSRTIEAPTPKEEVSPVANERTITYEEAKETTPVQVVEPTPMPVETRVTPAAEALPYQVIVGSFKDVANARDLILRLERMGYTPNVLDDNTSFTKVSIQGFSSRTEAAQALKGYKAKVQKGAWIYTVK